jgi:hypothetical protein
LTLCCYNDIVTLPKEQEEEPMTVAVACNTPEGVILGADSTTTLNDEQGRVVKTYENAVKLFQLGEKPVGIATYGLGSLGNRIIGTYVREFERQNPQSVVTGSSTMANIVEELRKFFYQQYLNIVVPQVERRLNKKFADIPEGDRPLLGMAVGGFSTDAYLSEVWHIILPQHRDPNSAQLMTGPGDFRSSWFALCEPIVRYHKGYDNGTLADVTNYFANARGTPLTPQETTDIAALLQRHEYQIPVGAMPLGEAIGYVKFLVEMVIYHYRFAVGAPVVGGRVQLGLISYRGKKFRILSPSEISYGLEEGEIDETS